MNYDDVKEIVNNYDSFSIHFCYRREADKYVALTPNVSEDVIEKIIEILIENIKFYESKSHTQYNQIGALDNTVETSDIDDFPIVQDLISSLDRPHSGDVTPQDIEFLVYELSLDTKKVFFLRRHNRLRTFRKKGFIARITDGSFDSFEQDDFIGIDDKVDLIVKENEISILYHVAFERIFNLSKGFIDAATDVVANDMFDKKVENFVILKEDLLDNMNYVKRISKLKDDGTSLLFLQDVSKTEDVIKKFNLDIDRNEEGQLVYRDKSQLGEFVNLMQDAYYETLIGEREGIDERG